MLETTFNSTNTFNDLVLIQTAFRDGYYYVRQSITNNKTETLIFMKPNHNSYDDVRKIKVIGNYRNNYINSIRKD